MTYLAEFRQNARPLAAAAIGSGSGLMVAAFTTAIFSPDLLKELGWSRAQFSLIGALLLPLCFIGYSLHTGRFWMILALSAATLAVGSKQRSCGPPDISPEVINR